MARQLIDEFDSDEQRLKALYTRALSRLPDDRELVLILRYLDASSAESPDAEAESEDSGAESEPALLAWQGICRTVVSSNEFLYVDYS